MTGSDGLEDHRAYVRAVIDAYVRLPATPARARREDRRLADELHARGVPLEVVETALLLGTLRKLRRPTQDPVPSTIRSLHYFLPVIEEILRDQIPAPYIDYLREIMAERSSGSPCAHAGASSQNYVSRCALTAYSQTRSTVESPC